VPLARGQSEYHGIAVEGAYASAIRMAAARSGAETVICYWGVLESARAGQPTKIMSWVPIVGSVVLDETQRMRIRLRMVVVDVRTGSWSMFSPDVVDDAALSASIAAQFAL